MLEGAIARRDCAFGARSVLPTAGSAPLSECGETAEVVA